MCISSLPSIEHRQITVVYNLLENGTSLICSTAAPQGGPGIEITENQDVWTIKEVAILRLIYISAWWVVDIDYVKVGAIASNTNSGVAYVISCL